MQTLLDRSTLARKFSIFGVLGIALLVAPLTMYLRLSQEGVSAAKLEQAGMEPVKKLMRVIQLTQQHRGLSANVLGGNSGLEPQRAAKQAEADGAVEAFSTVVKGENNAKLSGAWVAAVGNWKALEQGVAGRTINGAESYARHTALVAEYLVVVELVADYFGLTLDPEADGYYLMAAMLFHLPQLTESLGQARARGSLYLSQKKMTVDDRASLAALVGQVKMFHGYMDRALANVVETNAGLKRSLGSLSQDSARLVEQAMKLAKNEVLDAETLNYSGPEYFKTFTEVIDAQFRLNSTGLDELDKVLVGRIRGLRTSQAIVLGIIALVVLLSVWLGFAVTRSIMRQLGGEPALAAEVASRVAAGDLSKDIVLRSGDKTSLMAAMATMVGALRGFIAEQDRMAAKHAEGFISHQIPVEQFAGAFAEAADKTNKLVQSHVELIRKLTEVAGSYAKGDLSVQMDRLPQEKAAITEAMDTVKNNLTAINAEIKKLVEAASAGDFSARGEE
ncbi:MAG TPA: nitrate- and nitrite sensing domain-containing protein, partial [Burkholderiales bacterium]|nr:nitrate- and nitrite sensing domain-containing protein [Burkholderiales bacterium]